jgi:hypothetical protein
VRIATNGSAALAGSALQLTNDGFQNEASSTFSATPVNIDQSFTTDFTFQLLSPNADGITFTILNAEPEKMLNLKHIILCRWPWPLHGRRY